ncbi:hypothetical protein LCGC14_1259860 [marine sediment metagenome]|uniref:Uncharacterized protein n=1 Tax=marine sediment metagenome TaxID=412755 RepID=A0A0F9L3I5_9ZZZZ
MPFYTEQERFSAISCVDKEELLSLLIDLSQKYKLTASELVKYAVKEAKDMDKTTVNVEHGLQKNAGKKWTNDAIKELKKLCREKEDIHNIATKLGRSASAIIGAIKIYILIPQNLDPAIDMSKILKKYPMFADDDDYQRLLLKY